MAAAIVPAEFERPPMIKLRSTFVLGVAVLAAVAGLSGSQPAAAAAGWPPATAGQTLASAVCATAPNQAGPTTGDAVAAVTAPAGGTMVSFTVLPNPSPTATAAC